MKKIMIALAAVAMAACAQAAAINWNTGNLFDHNGTQMKYYETYTAVVSFFTYDSVNDTYTDVSASMGGTLTDSSATKTGAYSGATASSGIATGTYYAQVVITGRSEGDTTDWQLTSGMVQVNYDSAAIAATSAAFGSAFDTTGANYGWTAVPEPTSGLLMLVGLGALALRRRRA